MFHGYGEKFSNKREREGEREREREREDYSILLWRSMS
jgi:hypothetical protein